MQLQANQKGIKAIKTTSHKINLIPIKRNENDKMIDRLKGIETNNFT